MACRLRCAPAANNFNSVNVTVFAVSVIVDGGKELEGRSEKIGQPAHGALKPGPDKRERSRQSARAQTVAPKRAEKQEATHTKRPAAFFCRKKVFGTRISVQSARKQERSKHPIPTAKNYPVKTLQTPALVRFTRQKHYV